MTLETPHAGTVAGMGIPEGLTVIVGGGFHGKSTLLSAARGVYDHAPGDGRERVVTRADGVVIRAGGMGGAWRAWISRRSSARCSAARPRASTPTTRRAARRRRRTSWRRWRWARCRLLIMDEDTCATNFLIRDARMQRLVPAERADHAVRGPRDLRAELGVSTLLVLDGGSGDYLGVADTVIWMDAYRPREVTARAHAVAAEVGPPREVPPARPIGAPLERACPTRPASAPSGAGGIGAGARHEEISFGHEAIDLRAVEQLVDPSQTRAIGGLLTHAVARGYLDGRRTLADLLALLDADLDRLGLDLLAQRQGEHPGELARPRMLEVAAALNRLRTLRVR
ncbi:MAG: ABC-ATPase domain-containing protein [Thermomicrobiales bacterium]